MPTITCNLDDLQALVGDVCPLADLERRLALVKGELKSADPATGELRVELNDTNRPDLWSVEGIARQLRAKRTGGLPEYPCFASGGPVAGEIIVDASVAGVRPFVGGFLADGLTVSETLLAGLIQTQEKLSENFGQRRRGLAVGIYPAEVIRFPIHYRAVAPDAARFVPLGMDAALTLAEILTRHPKGTEYASILAGRDRYPLLADAGGEVLSFPPIINSLALGEVRPGDRRLFVEATGTDLPVVLLALNIFAADLSDRGATVRACAVHYPPATATSLGERIIVPHPLENRLSLATQEFRRLLGLALHAEDVARALRDYGCRVTVTGDRLEVATPPFRLDYLHPVDVIEDFAISVGYDTLGVAMPAGFTVGGLDPLTRLEDRTRDLLVGYAFEEVMTNVLTDRVAQTERLQQPAGGLVEIANVMSEAYAVLRRSLLASLLRVESASAISVYPHRLFEVGECAVADPAEPHGSRTVSRAAASIAHAAASFSELHSYLDRLCYDLGLAYRLVPVAGAPFVDGRHAQILAGDATVGEIGELHPEVLTAWGVRTPVAAFEIDLSRVLPLVTR